VTEGFFMKATDHILTKGTLKVNVQNFIKFYDPIQTFTKRLTPHTAKNSTSASF
jgi:hypothetical protein